MRFINTFQDGDDINGVYLCKSAIIREKKNGGDYLDIKLFDRTGEVDGKVWDINGSVGDVTPGMFVRVVGKVITYNNALQLKIANVRKAEEGEYLEVDYVPASEYNIDDMYKTLLAYVNSVTEPHLKALLEEFFVKDKEFISKFRKSSAAKTMHHAFVGGLLEHTLSVTQNCKFFAEKYKQLNYDLIITAALFHDIGKTRELTSFPSNDYSDEGNLLGHIVMGVTMLNEKLPAIPDFPKLLFDELCHCILAHHGKLEFGSPKTPAIAEAFALNFADDLDAKMETLKELFKANSANTQLEWLGYQRSFESNIRRTKV
ncbi:MAG: HD domain-containing protein [Lachnospiraceae bacterium]|nr:HD domain-containing protein [Lachnospiraceae bacterium]MBP5184373.1 HD domain-containing protein [Lachnospiraceae bacterium]